jgi:hypothetical protein
MQHALQIQIDRETATLNAVVKRGSLFGAIIVTARNGDEGRRERGGEATVDKWQGSPPAGVFRLLQLEI